MKKILIKIGAVVGVLALVFVLLTVFVRKKTAACHKGSGPEAIAACDFMIKYFPADFMKVAFLADRVTHFEKAGDKASALADLKMMENFHDTGRFKMSAKTIVWVYDRLCTLSSELGNSGDCVKYCGLAIKNSSQDKVVYLASAAEKINSRDYAGALPELQKSESMGESSGQLYYNMGAAYGGLGHLDSAYTYMKKAAPLMKTKEELARLNRMLGLVCMDLELYAEAKERLTQTLSAGYDCPECARAIAFADKKGAPPAPVKSKKRRAR